MAQDPKKKKSSLFKKYIQPNYEKANKEGTLRYKERNKQAIDNKLAQRDKQLDVSRGTVRKDTGYKGPVAPDYTPKSTYVKPNEDMSKRATTYTNKYPKYESSSYVPTDETPRKDYPESIVPRDTKSESPTGNLSAKQEPTSSEDRMSWAREAERKARKLMGGR